MKKWLCILVCCTLLLTLLAACGDNNGNGGDAGPSPDPQVPPSPPAVYTLDFADGKTDFLMMNTGSPGTDKDSKLEIGSVDGANALKMTAPNGGTLRLGINVSGLLGDAAATVKNVVFEVYAEYPDGNFSAVSGRIAAFSGDLTAITDATWQVYLASRNPNPATLEFGADEGFTAAGPNLIEFSCLTNGPADRGETPAVIYIKSITFYDAANAGLSVNTAAGWDAPDGYGDEVFLGGWLLPYPPPEGRAGDWQYWFTPGTDNKEEDYMPWEVVAASFGIELEMEQPEESFEFIFMGAFNGWSWQQRQVVDSWADGFLTIMWEDIGFDPTLVNDDDDQVKIAIGNWNEAVITKAYLLYDADAVPDGISQ